MKKTSVGFAYQMKITLKGIRPPIWRRFQVRGDVRLSRLHEIIQVVMGWTDSHLHQFLIDGTYYRQPEDLEELGGEDENKTVLSDVVKKAGKRFLYEYDFGDGWEHELLVEKIIPVEAGFRKPICLGGRRHRPPEDCGGVYGYHDFLEAIRDPRHKEHVEMLEWVGGAFDSEAFDLALVNRALAAPAVGRWRPY